MRPQTKRLSVLSAIVLALILTAYIFLKPSNQSPVPSTDLSPEKLHELKKKAEAGDAASKYSLSLFSDKASDAEKLVQESADLGYGPAVVTYVDSKAGLKPERSLALLEASAKTGYTPSIVALVICVERGQCGENKRLVGLKWAMVYGILRAQGKLNEDNLAGAEARLGNGVAAAEVDNLRLQAIQLAQELSQKK
jgi:hypothetical protein